MKHLPSQKEYKKLRKEGTFTRFIWWFTKDKRTPTNWLRATPIKIFGICLGWKCVVVKRGFEKLFFTSYEQ